jgi:hypothetical protein
MYDATRRSSSMEINRFPEKGEGEPVLLCS